MSRLDFEGSAIVVTGAGRGMGAAHAATLASRGARVLVNDLGGDMFGAGTSAEPAEETAQRIRDAGGVAVANGDSVATAEGCAAIVASAVETFGRLDGVLHNAGIARFAPIAETDEASFDDVLRVHLHGALNLTKAAWPHLAQRGGRLLYISSGAGLYGVPSLVGYASAKVGMLGLMRVAASEGRDVGIQANVLAVAAATRMMDWMKDTPNLHAWFQRYMKPELPAAAATWLLHPDCTASGRIYEAFGPHMAEVVVAETRGFTKLDITPEEFRDHLGEIEDRDQLVFPDGPDDFHAKMFGFAVEAGADPIRPDEQQSEILVVPDDQ
jgi:NAD(P)-dependent dehydrogenase (short-subunit alcohol dehydrogenase family)